MSELLSRFRGSLVGAVIGDCIGAVYEMNYTFTMSDVLKQIKSIEKSDKKKKCQYRYTDDTAMARSVAISLIRNEGFNDKDMAKRFADEYVSDSHRGYGGNVIRVFGLLLDPDLTDVYEPAREQFDGQGSFGNGGSMRIAPAALFSYNKDKSYLEKLSRQITKITHSHEQAIQGAILQCLAVHLALHTDRKTNMDTDSFISTLKFHMNILEEEALLKSKEQPPPPIKPLPKRESEKQDKPYCYKLDKMKEYLNQETEIAQNELIEVLGNDVSALGAVPAAVYSFLRATKPMEGDLKNRNGFENTIIYAISLMGDTDTIASMAGAIAGAYYGLDDISESWKSSCEGVYDAIKYADKLEKFVTKQ